MNIDGLRAVDRVGVKSRTAGWEPLLPPLQLCLRLTKVHSAETQPTVMPWMANNGHNFFIEEASHTSGCELFICRQSNSSGDVVCMLDADSALFQQCIGAALKAHKDVAGKEKRNWHPVLTFVGVKSLPDGVDSDPAAYITFIQNVLPDILSMYGKPYGEGRALLARSGIAAAALRSILAADKHDVHKHYRLYMLGDCSLEGAIAPATSAALPDKTQVYLSAAVGPGESAARARALESALLARMGVGVDTTMFVTRDGEQTYTHHERTGPSPVTLDLVAEQAADASGDVPSAFAAGSMLWVGERFEVMKLQSLGSLLPWHEFK